MNILGLNIEEDCSAAIMANNAVIAACSEERFRRQKCYSGFPLQSIEFCLKRAGLAIEEIDLVAVCDLGTTHMDIVFSYLQRRSRFTVNDYVREAHDFWYPRLYENKDVEYLDVFKDKIDTSVFPEEFNKEFFSNYSLYKKSNVNDIQNLKKLLIRSYFPQIPLEKIKFFPHHQIHGFYGYFSSYFPLNGQDVLIVTADSWGDNENGMIAKFQNGNYEILHTVDNHNLGRVFRNMTLFLGMKPYEHEYKVMGLAPYAPEYSAKAAYKIFDQIMDVDGINFIYKVKPRDYYFWFKQRLEGIRFDGVAAGVQNYFEDRIVKWISNAVKKFNIHRVCFSGGLAMNIKANMIMGQMEGIKDFFVAASPDDNSNCIGVCFLAMYRHLQENLGDWKSIQPLKDMYLGPQVEDSEIKKIIDDYELEKICDIKINAQPDFIAQRLSQGIVVGRCAGNMEFGARALGNRSILSDPRNIAAVNRINRIIKKRDFWMPFAPVILDTYWDKYLLNNNKLFSPYMTIGFKTSSAGAKDMPAAIHSADKTTRPQMLRRETNPYYYDIVSEFEKITGVGAILNTSFNLHGYPIILNAKDAADVLIQTDLDSILLNNTYIEKKQKVFDY